MKIEVFSTNGVVGILGTDVQMKGMGCVEEVNKDNFSVTQEAYDLLLQIPGSGDDMGEVDCFGTSDKIIFGWLGGPMNAFKPNEVTSSNDFDFTLLKDFISDEIKIPEAFIKTFAEET